MGERPPIRLGGVTWYWQTNVVCAASDERLVVTSGCGPGRDEARRALIEATRMEWRDHGFRRWRVERSVEGLTFRSHYETLGPVAFSEERALASLSSPELEALLTRARATTGSEGPS